MKGGTEYDTSFCFGDTSAGTCAHCKVKDTHIYVRRDGGSGAPTTFKHFRGPGEFTREWAKTHRPAFLTNWNLAVSGQRSGTTVYAAIKELKDNANNLFAKISADTYAFSVL